MKLDFPRYWRFNTQTKAPFFSLLVDEIQTYKLTVFIEKRFNLHGLSNSVEKLKAFSMFEFHSQSALLP